jgi:hypothetical protein
LGHSVTMVGNLSNLEKFGVLARRFLHEAANDFTAIGLNLHFLEQAIQPSHPDYQDFKNLAFALKSLQHHHRALGDWHRQLPDQFDLFQGEGFYQWIETFFRDYPQWKVHRSEVPNKEVSLKICQPWLACVLDYYLQEHPTGTCRLVIEKSHAEQCITEQQLTLTLDWAEPKPSQLGETDRLLLRELLRLLGGGLVAPPLEKPESVTIILPIY